MRRARRPAHIGQAVDELLAQTNLQARAREQLCALVWSQAVGEAVAQVSHVYRVREGVAYVRCESAVWAQQLSLQQRSILRKLRALLEGPYIKELRFRTTGPGPPAPQQPAESPAPTPSPEDLRAVHLSDQEVARITEVAAGAPTGELRQRLEEALLARERDRRWKLAHGYRPCRLCGNPFYASGPTCYACQWEGQQREGREGDHSDG